MKKIEDMVAEEFTTNRNAGIGPNLPNGTIPKQIVSKRAYNTIIELLKKARDRGFDIGYTEGKAREQLNENH